MRTPGGKNNTSHDGKSWMKSPDATDDEPATRVKYFPVRSGAAELNKLLRRPYS